MYYNSNNAVLRQPTVGANKVSSIVSYAMNGLFERLENIFEFKSGIKSSAVGYNSEEYEQLEKIYSMAYTKINSLEKNYVKANATLSEIEKLKDNWNDNGASAFSSKLIEKCRGIVMQLASEPFICPTACGSIQFEYEKENGDYLEFEIYEDRIECFLDTSGGEQEFNLHGISATDRMKQMVVDFYA
ncbi:hypothetical protein EBB54_29240 [Schaedlerella arabinosiphila]|uniref:Uncharacterized protein n=2 Tax=Schaedlerella TaxID=2676048 RepID=A0A3R8JUG8_9FIRM|nr:hypothetical protein [Schaedlerella arabinosiphila]RRK34966.1 hypothetical protein EBB54_29240 [Schaedlerella arabinosiphila]